jgi:hypothetical protein
MRCDGESEDRSAVGEVTDSNLYSKPFITVSELICCAIYRTSITVTWTAGGQRDVFRDKIVVIIIDRHATRWFSSESRFYELCLS